MSKYRVFWVNEMGEEQESYHETRPERDAKIEHLLDMNLDPGWQETVADGQGELELNADDHSE